MDASRQVSLKSIYRFQKIYFFFNSVLRPFQDYFSSYETGQSVGGAKTGEPASRTWLVSHVARAGLETTPDTAVRKKIFEGFLPYMGMAAILVM